jgi:uncharacterized protein (DUF1786 family)
MSDDPRTVEGALAIADTLKSCVNMLSGERAAYTLAAEVRRLQALVKPDAIAQAEAEVVRAAGRLMDVHSVWDVQSEALQAALDALAQARKEPTQAQPIRIIAGNHGFRREPTGEGA